MATFVKIDEHYVAGSLTLPQEYYVSDEMFARESLLAAFDRHYLSVMQDSQGE